MKREYSREDLFRLNQNDAKGVRDKKIAERQARVNEEKLELERINRELEITRMNEQNLKNININRMKDEYSEYVSIKQQSIEESKRSYRNKKEAEPRGTFKIGSENREIKKKTYDDVTDGLILNHNKQLPGSSQRSRRDQDDQSSYTATLPQRGKSQGYNIINHSVYNSEINRENTLNKNTKYDTNTYSNYNNEHKEVEGIENLANYHRHYDINNSNKQNVEVMPSNVNSGEDKMRRYYEEYLNKKLNEENEYVNNNINKPYNDRIQYESGVMAEEYPKNNEINNDNELEVQMENMNIANDSRSEYLSNKIKNQNCFASDYKTVGGNIQQISNATNKKTSQDVYRSYLDAQIKGKSKPSTNATSNVNVNSSNQNNFNKTKSKKDVAVAINPYSGKNYEFGGSSLQNNPITNPVNSYNYESNRLKQVSSYANNEAKAMSALNTINLRDISSGRNSKSRS